MAKYSLNFGLLVFRLPFCESHCTFPPARLYTVVGYNKGQCHDAVVVAPIVLSSLHPSDTMLFNLTHVCSKIGHWRMEWWNRIVECVLWGERLLMQSSIKSDEVFVTCQTIALGEG